MDADRAFQVYEEVRDHLPDARFPANSRTAADLLSIADEFDVFVFDAFGVLNVGETPIDGALSCVSSLRDSGKQVFVLTNAASHDRQATAEKFFRLGYDFSDEEIVSSRSAAEHALSSIAPSAIWGVACAEGFQASQLDVPTVILEDDFGLYERSDAILFLSTGLWTAERQLSLVESLKNNPRPVVIANPDIVAPRETGLSIEPGYFGHQLRAQTDVRVSFFGKPFSEVFAMVRAAIDPSTPNHRIAMIGDTLHTDILGGKAAGWTTILVTDHGLFRGLPYSDYICRSGIVPDWFMPSIG